VLIVQELKTEIIDQIDKKKNKKTNTKLELIKTNLRGGFLTNVAKLRTLGCFEKFFVFSLRKDE
jgi:hypothetical protein